MQNALIETFFFFLFLLLFHIIIDSDFSKRSEGRTAGFFCAHAEERF